MKLNEEEKREDRDTQGVRRDKKQAKVRALALTLEPGRNGLAGFKQKRGVA